MSVFLGTHFATCCDFNSLGRVSLLTRLFFSSGAFSSPVWGAVLKCQLMAFVMLVLAQITLTSQLDEGISFCFLCEMLYAGRRGCVVFCEQSMLI